jgi:hypothetical protein
VVRVSTHDVARRGTQLLDVQSSAGALAEAFESVLSTQANDGA